MVKVTVDLVRKKAEHHERQLAPLEEISLHQESIDKIEFIQDWCPKLRILLLQSNLIPKIENLNKLKELQYLNLAINNIEKIENMEKCESLEKLDLTLNFIGDLESVKSLKPNYNLRQLYLNGNPCADYQGYREYVIAILPQLSNLDNEEIKRSERILAMQNIETIEKEILHQQQIYAAKRKEQKHRLERELIEKSRMMEGLDDEEKCKRFWKEKTEHAPEVRIEMDKFSKRRDQVSEKDKPPKQARKLFTNEGRPLNINEPKIGFKLEDEDNKLSLELRVYKYLDTSYIEIDVQPLYVRATIKGKIFQICLPEEINVENSNAKRSTTTGFLTIIMPKINAINLTPKTLMQKITGSKDITENNSKREYLEIGPKIDIYNIVKYEEEAISTDTKTTIGINLKQKVKEPSSDFVDDLEVPPLI